MQKQGTIIDAHSDIPTEVFLRREAGEKNVLDKWHYSRLKEGGITLQVMAIYVESRYKPWRSLEIALRQLEALLEDLAESRKFFLVTTREDLKRVGVGEEIGVLLDMEGAEPLEPGPEMLQLFYRLGIRMLGVTWNQRNALASGIDDEASGSGLTSYGREVLQEASRLGMLIDVSHMAPNGVRDTLEAFPMSMSGR
jgi:membrane dipeptidase